MSNIRQDVLESYNILIEDCKSKIEKDIDVESNELLLKEYLSVFNHVKNKSEEEYVKLDEEISELHQFSTLIHNSLRPIFNSYSNPLKEETNG